MWLCRDNKNFSKETEERGPSSKNQGVQVEENTHAIQPWAEGIVAGDVVQVQRRIRCVVLVLHLDGRTALWLGRGGARRAVSGPAKHQPNNDTFVHDVFFLDVLLQEN